MHTDLNMPIVAMCSFFRTMCDDDYCDTYNLPRAVERALSTHPSYGLSRMPRLDFGDGRGVKGTWHVLCFGAYGDTFVASCSDTLEHALEDCAAVLGKRHFCDPEWEKCPHCHEDIEDSPEDRECPHCDEHITFEDYVADLTYTESGYLMSHEWGISIDGVGVWKLVEWQLGRQ